MSQGFTRTSRGETGAPGPVGPAGAGSSGAALFELAPVDSPIFVGRYTPGSGVMQQMSPPTAVGMLPVFSLVAKGLVPAPGTAAGLFLRDDATWAAAGAAGRPSGVTLGEQAVAPPFTLQGRLSIGTGGREDLSVRSVASALPVYLGTGFGFVPVATGLSASGFGLRGYLRADGSWNVPPAPINATNVPYIYWDASTNVALADQNGSQSYPFSVLQTAVAACGADTGVVVCLGIGSASENFTFDGQGINNSLTIVAARGSDSREPVEIGIATLQNHCHVTMQGIKLAQVVGTSSRLWANQCTVGTLQMQTGNVRLRGGQAATPGDTSIPWSVGNVDCTDGGTFAAFAMKIAGNVQIGGTSATLENCIQQCDMAGGPGYAIYAANTGTVLHIDQFSLARAKAQNYSITGVNNTGVVSLLDPPQVAASGVSVAQLGDIQSPRILGRVAAGSGAVSQLLGADVATMLPRFFGSGVGLVPAPTGGTLARFLGDNGQWSIPLASGITNAQLALRPPSVILGRSGSTGIVEELVGSGVATLLPLFNDIHKGLVPGSAGGTTAFLRADGSWAIPSTSGGVSGVAFNQIQDISAPRFLGRLSGSGSIQELTPGQGASLIPPFFASGARGVVLGPTGGVAGAFLRDDGSWATPAGGSATGVSNAQLGAMPPFTFKARQSLGSGIPEDISVGAAASMLPRFAGSGVGLAPHPTGGNVRSFLRDDGQWQIPLASGIANAQLAAMLAPSVKGKFTLGSGIPEDLTGAQVASMIQNFSTTTAGLVPVPTLAVATGAFIDNRGNWSTPTGLSNGQLALMPPSRIKGSSGTTGLPQDLVGSMVSTLLPLFNDVDKGLVPGSAGGVAAFLRADGNWATPNAGGTPSGILFNQIGDITGDRFLGRRPIGSGSIEQLTPEQVATMLPVFSGALRGMVPPPAGGGPSGFFLKDDGSWFPLLGPEITGPTTTGFGTAAGSMTIDFSAGPYHTRLLGGNTKFYITPPSMMRHTQLRTRNGASGICPTFFGSMVKWAGGSAMHPSLFNRASGAVNIINFAFDGTFMNATVGAGFA